MKEETDLSSRPHSGRSAAAAAAVNEYKAS